MDQRKQGYCCIKAGYASLYLGLSLLSQILNRNFENMEEANILAKKIFKTIFFL